MAKGKPKGSTKTGGRQAGTPNKTTEETKEFIKNLLQGEHDNIIDALSFLKSTNNDAYLNQITKLLQYVVPKLSPIDSKTGETITPNVTIQVLNGKPLDTEE